MTLTRLDCNHQIYKVSTFKLQNYTNFTCILYFSYTGKINCNSILNKRVVNVWSCQKFLHNLEIKATGTKLESSLKNIAKCFPKTQDYAWKNIPSFLEKKSNRNFSTKFLLLFVRIDSKHELWKSVLKSWLMGWFKHKTLLLFMTFANVDWDSTPVFVEAVDVS